MTDTIVDYFSLNKIYVLITTIILVGFIIIIRFLVIQFQIEISKEINRNNADPIAIYFDKETRDNVLAKSIIKQNELRGVDANFKNDTNLIKRNIKTLNTKMKNVRFEFDDLQKRLSEEEAKALVTAKQTFMDLSGVVSNIKTQYIENKTSLENLIDNYDKTFNNNVELMIDVGNNLVKKLASNVYTKKWTDKRKQFVSNYDKIKSYLSNLVNQKLIAPEKVVLTELTKEAREGKKI
jgi:regulator of replication initiation timing